MLRVCVTQSARLAVLTRYVGALMNLVNIMWLKNGADNRSVVFCNYYRRFCQISQTIAFCPNGVECSKKKTHDKFWPFVDFGGPRGTLSMPLVTLYICNAWNQDLPFIIIIGPAGWTTKESELDSR